jgi:rhodanese-related sulfurtransferase
MTDQTHRQRLLTLFGQTGAVLEDFVSSRVQEEQRRQSTSEGYSATDLLRMITFWMLYTVERIGYYQRGEEPPHAVDFDAVQTQALASSVDRDWSDAVSSVRRALAALMASVERSSEALLEANNFYGDDAGGPLWGEVQANGFIVPLEECERYLRRIGDVARADQVRARLTPVAGEQESIVCDLAQPETVMVWQRDAAHTAVVIDVRGAADFARGHVQGARHIPLSKLAQQAKRLPKDRPIVTYCNMHHPGQSRGEQSARLLSEAGFQAAALAGGYPAWETAGLPIEATQQQQA